MLKRASRKLRSTPAKTLMYIILFLVLFLAIFSMLMIGIASGNKVKRAQETLANSITLRGPAGRSWKIMYCICDPVRNRRKVH